MPVTPYHLGPGAFLGIVFKKYLHIPTVIVASVILDIEPFTVLILELNRPLHMLTHNFLVATIISMPLTLTMNWFKAEIDPFMGLFRLEQKTTLPWIAISALVGTWSHVILDAFLYTDMLPFYPSGANPLLWMVGLKPIKIFCVISFIVAAAVYAVYLQTRKPA